METLSVLQFHSLDIPNNICIKLQECLDLIYHDDIGLKYRPVKTAKLCDLVKLSQDISELISLVEPSLDTLFFVSDPEQDNYVLKRFIDHYKIQLKYFIPNETDHTSINKNDFIKLNTIVDQSEASIFRLINGSSTYKEVIEILSLKFLRDSNGLLVSNELKNFMKMKLGECKDSELSKMREKLKCLLILFDVSVDLDTFRKVCEMYKLEFCLRDPKMHQLQEIVVEMSSKESHEKITLNNGVDKVNFIKESLQINDLTNTLTFKLISTVCDSCLLYEFCLLKKFASIDGYKRFEAEYKLVRIAMEKEDYCEQIINQLRGAMFVLSPFLNSSTTLTTLMSEINKLTNIPVGISLLMIIESNIDVIEVSFNTIQVC